MFSPKNPHRGKCCKANESMFARTARDVFAVGKLINFDKKVRSFPGNSGAFENTRIVRGGKPMS